jgi:hypothetical protein
MTSDEGDIIDALASSELFRDLSEPQLERFGQMSVRVPVRNGELIFRSDQPGSAIYVLKEGMISVEFSLSQGIHAVIELCGPRKALGWSCLRPEGTYSVSVRSLMTGEIVALPTQGFTTTVDGDPYVRAAIYANVFRLMNRRLQALAEQLSPELVTEDRTEPCPRLPNKEFAWRVTPQQAQAHCVGETCTVREAGDCPLVGLSPLEWHSVLPRQTQALGA